MKIVVCGVPGTGKEKFAKQVLKVAPKDGWEVYDLKKNKKKDLVFGFLTDYRVEAEIAAERAIAARAEGNMIFTNSLLDSLMHSLYYYNVVKESDDEQAVKYSLLSMLIGFFIKDSFEADHLFYIPYTGDDDELQRLDQVLKNDILAPLSVTHVELNNPELSNAEIAAMIFTEENSDAINEGSDPEESTDS